MWNGKVEDLELWEKRLKVFKLTKEAGKRSTCGPIVLAKMQNEENYHKYEKYLHGADNINLWVILSGRFETIMEDGTSVILEAGDSMIEVASQRAFRNPGPERCTAAIVARADASAHGECRCVSRRYGARASVAAST